MKRHTNDRMFSQMGAFILYKYKELQPVDLNVFYSEGKGLDVALNATLPSPGLVLTNEEKSF